jgi:energy-coupling factor transporter ATP-binding protein EcfA2
MADSSGPLISAIRVEKLFGLYTYELPNGAALQNAAILYGDNGVGKSTILRLAFHALSPADDRGHRTALTKVDFAKFQVDLASGITISAERTQKSDPKFLQLTITRGNEVLAQWDYRPGPKSAAGMGEGPGVFYYLDEKQAVVRYPRQHAGKDKGKPTGSFPQGEAAYMEALTKHVPTMFILNSDRRLDSDSVPNPSDEMELRRVMRFEEPKLINDLVARSREIALSQAMNTAGAWVGQKAIQGANRGSTNVHSVYVDVLHHIVKPSAGNAAAVTREDVASLIARLKQIEEKTERLARYELATILPVEDLYKALRARSHRSSSLAAELLKPYIASLEGRLNAVKPVYEIIDRFVSIINQFLSDKSLSFKLSEGFKVRNRLQTELSPAQLSSGEQQLLLLFYYVLTGREKPSVFIIDEPEISLNIKWQRRLVQSLLDVTEGANIQFLFASHSIELLAQHRNRVIRLQGAK